MPGTTDHEDIEALKGQVRDLWKDSTTLREACAALKTDMGWIKWGLILNTSLIIGLIGLQIPHLV
jgi:hypothetical protein